MCREVLPNILLHPMSSIYLYAELLLNIRQVTVLAMLPSNCNENTSMWLCHDQKTLRLRHEDQEAATELPCSVVHDADLKIPPATRELSFRLVVSDAARLPAQNEQATDYNDPWPALGLTSETLVACGSCGALLVNNVNVWKHLPSAGWADMMDFWHCHKPSADKGDGESAGRNKGYAAANALGPTAGIGLVDVSHFMVSDIDCTGLEVGKSLLLLLRMSSICQERATRRRPASEISVPWQGRRYSCPRRIQSSTVSRCLTYPLHP